MRNRFLSVIASFLILSISLTGCLDSDDTYSPSTDASVHGFALDTIFGVDYAFSIDQLNRTIFNMDSLPLGADTIIDSIRVTTFSTTGMVVSGINDTVFNMNNYQDLREAARGGLTFRVYAADGITTREYRLFINIHTQDPDSMKWHDVTAGFPIEAPMGEAQKTIVLNHDGQESLLVYAATDEGIVLCQTPAALPASWTRTDVTTLPADVQLHSMVKTTAVPTARLSAVDQLYVCTATGDVYTSADGIDWQPAPALSAPGVSLVTGIGRQLCGIATDAEGVSHHVATDDPAQGWTLTGDAVDDAFPRTHLCATGLTTVSGVAETMVTGYTEADKVLPWATTDGLAWVQMDGGAYNAALNVDGVGHYPSLMYYGERFYAFGERLDTVYSSEAALAWQGADRKFYLPAEAAGDGYYSMAIDGGQYIWLVATKNEQNRVWRGRLNRLGFKRQ